jgi:flagellar hook-associated protein 3 FlgL
MSSTTDAIPDDYTVTLSQAAQGDPVLYSVVGAQGGAIATGTYESGAAITFNGITLVVEGTVENGDSYSVVQSARQNIFQSVQAIADALLSQTNTSSAVSKLTNDLGQAIGTLDQGLEHLQGRRTIVGNRLQTLENRIEKNADERLRLETQVSEIQDLDFAEAVSLLNLQSTALQAAQQAYVKIQGLSLFNFLR